VREELISHGVAPMQGIGDTMKAMAAAATYNANRTRLLASAPMPLMLIQTADKTTKMRNEWDSKSLLKTAGVKTPHGVICRGDNITFDQLSFPVVVKAVSADLPHKSECEAVQVGLTNPEDAKMAMEVIRQNCARLAPAARIDGILVEEMVTNTVAEIMVSLRRDNQFGCILTVASGGVLVELLKDAVTVIMPTDDASLNDAIDQLAVARLIDGYRGKAAGNRQALHDAIMSLSRLMASDPNIHMVEINPFMITPDHAIAADAVIHVSE